MSLLQVQAIKTNLFHANDNLIDFIMTHIPRKQVQEKMLIAITSKIVSLAEGCLISKNQIDKASLVKKEADVFLGEVGHGCFLTIKENLFIPSAGIDESNSENGDYIVYPKDPSLSAHRIWSTLRKNWEIKNLGIILTDSHTSPLRQGVTGICLSYWGFEPVKNMVGTKDLFGRELQMTKMNLADGLAATAVMVMGEGSESQPLAIITGTDLKFSETCNPKDLHMPLEQDLYYPFFKKINLIP